MYRSHSLTLDRLLWLASTPRTTLYLYKLHSRASTCTFGDLAAAFLCLYSIFGVQVRFRISNPANLSYEDSITYTQVVILLLT